jgi:hypothetical protein
VLLCALSKEIPITDLHLTSKTQNCLSNILSKALSSQNALFTLSLRFNHHCRTLATLQVNYHSDGGCSDYLTEIYLSTDGACYRYDWTGTNSAKIARCTFYTPAG